MFKFSGVLCVVLVCNQLHAFPLYQPDNIKMAGEVRERTVTVEEYRVTLHVRNVTINRLFDEIHQQTKLDFVYNTEQLKAMPLISVDASDESVFEVLGRVFAKTMFSFKRTGNIISIIQKEEKKQNDRRVVITGIITDDLGEPLVGATVQASGKEAVTITDVNGHYLIQVSDASNSSLAFSFVGMKAQNIAVKGRTTVNVQLDQDAIAINDVVIMGAYGTAQKRSDLVGSAFQVNADQLKALPALRVDKMLDGLMPGVRIDPNTDSPDSTRPRYNVRVRGDASLSASNEPLWVVDGTPIYTGEHTNQVPGMSATISPLSFMNPDDIESITVLKDATATSIYGANGANGVILVTTKKGIEGKMRVSLMAQYGVAQIDKSTNPKVLNASQYLTLAKETYANAGNDLRYFPFMDNEMNRYSKTDTDWTDVFYDLGNTFQANLSLSGGGKDSKYYLSGSYFENTATIKSNKQQRFSVRSNLDFTFHRKFKVGCSI